MIYLRKSEDRGRGDHGWLKTRFSFSFADYYDPRFVHFSALRVMNEDHIAPSSGFPMHPHNNMEILTYILSGSIAHEDSMGNRRTISAGEFQIMSAGTGVYHSEFNASDTEPLHLYQIWVIPNQRDVEPRYDERFLPKEVGKQLILSPEGRDNSFVVYQDMTLTRQLEHANHIETLNIAENRHVYLQVVSGKISVGEITAKTGDALMISEETALTIEFQEESEILIFDLP